jgi:hypothetical protein
VYVKLHTDGPARLLGGGLQGTLQERQLLGALRRSALQASSSRGVRGAENKVPGTEFRMLGSPAAWRAALQCSATQQQKLFIVRDGEIPGVASRSGISSA